MLLEKAMIEIFKHVIEVKKYREEKVLVLGFCYIQIDFWNEIF